MASVQLPPSFDGPNRPQTHQGIHASPAASPRIPRPSSQASIHIPPGATYSPSMGGDHSPGNAHPFTAYPGAHPQPFRHYQPGGLSLPLPHQPFSGGYPSSAPPMHNYYTGPAPLYDARISQPMVRTVSHAHPMHSATEHTASSRYSSSPHSATHDVPPPTAGYPSFHIQDTDERHVNPAMLNSYSMSRSTSGASEAANDINGRLLTPHLDYRPGDSPLNPHEAELRKVSDSLGRISSGRYYPHTLSPQLELQGGHHALGGGFGAHPQPDMSAYMNQNMPRGWGNDYALSAERGAMKAEMNIHGETDYERERAQQIMSNRKLLEDVGLGADGNTFFRSRNVGGISHERSRKSSTPVKRRIPSEAPVRASPRIASLHRNMSYADLDGGPMEEQSDDEYNSDVDLEEEDDFRPTKRSKGSKFGGGRKPSYAQSNKISRKPELSLWGLLEVYAEVPHLFPLFYYTLNNDLTINSDSVPLIGSIPSTCTPLEKADTLRGYFHRGRRVLVQLDAFASRCDRKYEGPEERWAELDYHTRIAVRDVRRKIVERCENYKYTRRDILDKVVGKNKWQPIEHGMIEWRAGMGTNDPASDLANVTLTLPTPPPNVYAQQSRQQQQVYPSRQIKPFPSRARLVSGLPSAGPRTVSVTMGEPDQYHQPATAPIMGYGYPPHQAPPPMYGEDEVPLTVQMPVQSSSSHPSPLPGMNSAVEIPSSATLAPPPSSWAQESQSQSQVQPLSRGMKGERDEDEGEDENKSGEELETTLWHE